MHNHTNSRPPRRLVRPENPGQGSLLDLIGQPVPPAKPRVRPGPAVWVTNEYPRGKSGGVRSSDCELVQDESTRDWLIVRRTYCRDRCDYLVYRCSGEPSKNDYKESHYDVKNYRSGSDYPQL